MATKELLEIKDLYVNFYTYQGVVKALDGISLSLFRGETFGLVGETGCGKSVTARSILKLIPMPPGKMESGNIVFNVPEDVMGKVRKLDLEIRDKEDVLRDSLSKRISEITEDDFETDAELKRLRAELYTRPPVLTIKGRSGKGSKPRIGTMDKKAKILPSAQQPELYKLKLERSRLLLPYDILGKGEKYMEQVRGKYISIIFQEPMSSLNPVMTSGYQISETYMVHERSSMAEDIIAKHDEWAKAYKANPSAPPEYPLKRKLSKAKRNQLRKTIKNPKSLGLKVRAKVPGLKGTEKMLYSEALSRSTDMLKLVRIPDAENVIESYPYELSGGMQQRVAIAIGLACAPQLLIADEPTTALDVTVQAQILKLMNELQDRLGTTILMITHNLGVVAETCDRVGVMYAGVMAEIAPVREIFKAPLHPYTKGLIKSIPRLNEDQMNLDAIEGNVPNLVYPPNGCRFHPRCEFAMDICKLEKPRQVEVKPGHFVTCHLYKEGQQ